jgi:hypothetical protein
MGIFPVPALKKGSGGIYIGRGPFNELQWNLMLRWFYTGTEVLT